MCDNPLHSSCWCRLDQAPAFILPEGSTQASAVDSSRTAELSIWNQRQERQSCPWPSFFLLGKPFSDESHPDFTPCPCMCMRSQRLIAGRQPGRTSWPVQALCIVGQYPIESHGLCIALPRQDPPPPLLRLF